MELRKRFLKKYFKSVGTNLRVHIGVTVRNPDKLVLGNNVTLGVNTFIQAAGGVTIGNDVILGPDVKIWSANHVFKDLDTPVRSQGYEFKEVKIGNDVWVAANAFIMPGVNIGDGVIIAAGSVVGAKSYLPYTILAGNPARKVGERGK